MAKLTLTKTDTNEAITSDTIRGSKLTLTKTAQPAAPTTSFAPSSTPPTATAHKADTDSFFSVDDAMAAAESAAAALKPRNDQVKAANTAAADALRTQKAAEPETPGYNWGDFVKSKGLDTITGELEGKDATQLSRVGNVGGAASTSALSSWQELLGLLTSTQKGDTSTADTFNTDADIFADRSGKVLSAIDRWKQSASDKAYAKADELAQQAAEHTVMAKDGLGIGGSMLVDAGIAGAQLAGDVGIAALTGGSALPLIGIRSFGSGAQEARRAGADPSRQFGYGALSAVTEILTEKIGSVASPFTKAYGKGALDKAISKAVEGMAGTAKGGAALKMLLSAASEGGEEAVSALVNPILKAVTFDENAMQEYKDPAYWAGVLSDTLVGGLLGLAGGAVDVVGAKNAPSQLNNANDAVASSGNLLYNKNNGGNANDTAAANHTETDARSGIPGVQGDLGADARGRENGRGDSELSGQLLLKPETRDTLNKQGVVDLGLRDSSGDSATFVASLTAAREADAKNGWAVSPQTAESLQAEGVKTYLSADGFAGVGVKADGDITAVFKHPKSAKGASRDLMAAALENGGNKLDCYGDGLVKLYAQQGFVPVARVTFNAEYANEGWTPDKGSPDIYFMMHNGDSVEKVVGNFGKYPTYTLEQLNALPLMDYDAAYAYRDGMQSNAQQASGTPPAPAQNGSLPSGVGAANQGFAGTVERGFSHNVATDNAMNETIREDYQLDPEMYNRLGNKETLGKAQAIYDSGLDTARATVERAIGAAQAGAKLSPEMVPLARMVANTLAKQGDLDGARNILSSVAIELTQAGQLGQAANILRQSDAATVLQTVEKQLQKINEAGRKKYGKKWKDFTLTEDELQAISKVNEGDTVAIQAVIQMIGKRVGSEMPSTAWNKITEFRRVAMLLNPKTQIRNILGNVPLAGMRKLSETMSAAVQDMAVHMGLLDKSKQTRTLGVSKESKQIANELYQQQKSALMKIDKWDITSIINENQAVFKTVPLEKVRTFIYWLLEKGDLPFLKSAFIDNAAGYIEAQGYKTAYDVPQKVIDAATKEALAATFRDASALAQWLNMTKRNSGVGGAALDVLLPFTTTPINIARRTADYSPLGALKLLNVSNRTEATKVIDILTKSVTGTGIMFLGFMLSKLGWITGGQDKDRDKAQFELATGKQPYSIMGKYSYDWAQPVGTQLAIGAEMYKAIQGDTTLVNAILNSIYAGGDAMLNLTFFSNIQDLFDGYGSTTENTAETLATGFASQLIPTLLGQFARTTDTSVRSTYTGGSLFEDILAQAKSKIPGLSSTLPESVDIRGETKTRHTNPLARAMEQFVSPGTINANQQTATDEEIQRVYDSTGDTGVFPRYALGYFTSSGTKYTMTGEERSQFQTTLGTETYSGLADLFKDPEYKSATDAEKAGMIADVISAANDTAKQELVEARGDMYLTTSGRETVSEYVSAGLTEKKAYELYKALDALEPTGNNKSVTTFQKVQTIAKQSYTQKQKIALVASLYTNTSRESLLTDLNISDNLISRYLTTEDTDFINMTVPASFTESSVEYELTDKERQLFRSTYTEYFNLRATNVMSDDALKRLRDKAYEAAKQAVLRSRR